MKTSTTSTWAMEDQIKQYICNSDSMKHTTQVDFQIGIAKCYTYNSLLFTKLCLTFLRRRELIYEGSTTMMEKENNEQVYYVATLYTGEESHIYHTRNTCHQAGALPAGYIKQLTTCLVRNLAIGAVCDYQNW